MKYKVQVLPFVAFNVHIHALLRISTIKPFNWIQQCVLCRLSYFLIESQNPTIELVSVSQSRAPVKVLLFDLIRRVGLKDIKHPCLCCVRHQIQIVIIVIICKYYLFVFLIEFDITVLVSQKERRSSIVKDISDCFVFSFLKHAIVVHKRRDLRCFKANLTRQNLIGIL